MTTRIGTFCFRYRWWVLVAWVVVMVAGALSAPKVFANAEESRQLRNTESGQAGEVLDAHTDEGMRFVALVEHVDPRTRAVAESVDDAVADVERLDGVKRVGERGADDHTGVALTVILDRFADDADDAEDRAFESAKARLEELADTIPHATVRFGGGDLIGDDANEAVQKDLMFAEFGSLPVTLLVCVVVFGGLVAASVPVLAALVTIASSFAGLLAFSRVVGADPNMMSVVTLLGLGLCIDYSLLLVARYREELATGHDRVDAIARTWGSAGRTVFFSALTVSASLVSLMVFDIPRLQQFGAAAISAAVFAMVTALTFTAAILGVFGKGVKPSKRQVRREAGNDERGFFAVVARFCQRRPALVTIACAVALMAAAAPALSATMKIPQLEGLPRDLPAVAVSHELARNYGQSTDSPVVVVARTDASTLDDWAARWQDDPEVSRVEDAESVGPNLSVVTLLTRHDPQGEQARALVERVRADRPTTQSWVAGDAAAVEDLMGKITARLPWALGITAVMVFVLLFLMTGSVVVPLKVIVTGVLSLGTTAGVLVAVFEHGWLSGPLDTLTIGGLSPFMLVMVFGFAFGLSMDYEVFLLARIKEHVDAGHPTHTAVRLGLQRSGRIITSAALAVLILFAFFGAAKMGDLEQVGIGIFVAVLVDATVVRCLLVPATMTLLDRWNWWAPAPLRRLHHRFGVSETATEPRRDVVDATV